MIRELFKNLDESIILELWPNYEADEEKIIKHTKTNIRYANIALESILKENEKKCLEQLFFGDNGWYKKINSEGMIRLKLAAMSLGMTNNVFTFDAEKEKQVISEIKKYSQDEQLLVMSCYMKQKTVTYMTMFNYLKAIRKTDKKSIELYRGINTEYKGEKYLFSGLECWSTSVDSAMRFAGGNGYVIKKEYQISQIFSGTRSTYKNKANNMYRNNGFYVRREHEMIIENYEQQYDCSGNIILSVDRDIY